MIKKLSLLFALILLPLIVGAQTLVDGICYNLDADTKEAEITYNESKCTGSIVIPESFTYNGVTYSVTSIGEYAFAFCSGLTSVTIPGSVTEIANNAFFGCYIARDKFINNSSLDAEANNYWGLSLVDSREDGFCITNGVLIKYMGSETSVTIPNSVTSLGERAFYECPGLTSVTIPNSVTSIGSRAFYCCSDLASVTIPNSVTEIESRGFFQCALTSITIPNSVKSIGESAFYYCNKLKSVTIGNSVITIGSYAFSNCSSLTSLTIPSSVTEIGRSAFGGCYIDRDKFVNNSSLDAEANNYWGLTLIDSRDDGFWIGNGVLIKYVGSETTVTIPNSVTAIGWNAFSQCSGMTSVTIPNSVTSIGSNAFQMCRALTSVTIPNGVTEIANSVFSDCSGLTSVTIPNSVTSIGGNAFEGCKALKSLTIPNSVTSIARDAFYRSGLTYVNVQD